MTPLIAALPGNEHIAATIAERLGADVAELEFHPFPDSETYLRIKTPVRDRSIVLVCTLDRPDAKILPLIFAASTARELGAARVGLVAPYLPYMRQDRRFNPGEALTSKIFADILSRAIDWLVTVDPHLHRVTSLADLYRIPSVVLHAAPLISQWISTHVQHPLLIGPDEESRQWVNAVASAAGAPFVVLEKTRLGDRQVSLSVPGVEQWKNHTPVLVDDIISSAGTMLETLHHLARAGMKPAVCIGIHGIFAPGAYEALKAAGPSEVATTNSVLHKTNAIDLTALLVDAVAKLAP